MIFSRLPIVDSGLIRFPKPSMAEAFIYADVVMNTDTVRVYTTHLQSVQFKKQDFETIEKLKKNEDGAVENSKGIFAKLKRGVVKRSVQAEVVRNMVARSPHPFVLTGDFNDVPNSYTYFTIKGDRKDAFTQSGKGIGRTFSNVAPTLRIDYIITDEQFTVDQYIRHFVPYSEHYPVIADLTLRDTAN